MFTKFSTQKTNYESGQVFPFLIAIIVIVIIMAMITVNLGQLALYRTDVSNAADAGALAGASVLSGQLLGWGLTSDFMCGQNLAKIAGIVLGFVIGGLEGGLGIGIAILTTAMSSNVTAMLKAMTDSQMALTNARKTAMQYAYSNIGVDEPRPTYQEFLDKIGDSPTVDNYDEYLKGESTNARLYARSGFTKFMDNGKVGWWWDGDKSGHGFGSVESGPDAPVPYQIVTSGYGWGHYKYDVVPPSPGTPTNSYERFPPPPNLPPDAYPTQYTTCMENFCWQGYDNWVEVQSSTTHLIYSFELVDLGWIQKMLAVAAFGFVFFIRLPIETLRCAWAGPLAPLIGGLLAAAEALIVAMLVNFFKFGLGFDNDDEYIENSYVDVTVRRYKKGENVGLWSFRYHGEGGTPVQAFAKGHAYREDKYGDDRITIEPTVWGWRGLFALLLLFVTASNPYGWAVAPLLIKMWDDLFDTSRHLFETEIAVTE